VPNDAAEHNTAASRRTAAPEADVSLRPTVSLAESAPRNQRRHSRQLSDRKSREDSCD
jgi:hypothetical protein